MRHGAKVNRCNNDGCTNQVGKEECVLGMGQRLDYAAKKDVQIRFRKEEYELGVGQRLDYENYFITTQIAAKKDIEATLRKEQCAVDMGHIAIQKMNLLHLDQNSDRQLQLNLNPMSMLLKLP